MKLTIGHVCHALEFVKHSLEKIAPINYSQKMRETAEIHVNLRSSPSVMVFMPTLR